MFDRIVYISNNGANVKIKEGQELSTNIMNMHVVFEDEKKKILGEVDDIDGQIVKINFLGELEPDRFVVGVIRKPNLDAKVRLVTPEEMKLIVGDETQGTMELGKSPLYDSCPVRVNVNELFSNHMAIFGNSGGGKSCGVTRLIQNVFSSPTFVPFRSNFFIFDSSGEYLNAFKDISSINNNFNYKFYSTNYQPGVYELKLPIWLTLIVKYLLLKECINLLVYLDKEMLIQMNIRTILLQKQL